MPPGEFAFDPVLRDPPRTDRAAARTTAKYTEYPDGHLRLTGGAWPWRPTLPCAAPRQGSGRLARAGGPRRRAVIRAGMCEGQLALQDEDCSADRCRVRSVD